MSITAVYGIKRISDIDGVTQNTQNSTTVVPSSTTIHPPVSASTSTATPTPTPVPTSPSYKPDYTYDDIIQYCSTDAVRYTPVEYPSYLTYKNSEYFISIDYPSHFIRSQTGSELWTDYRAPDNSAILRITTAKNTCGLTPKGTQNAFINLYHGEVTYSPCKDDWFAISVNNEFLNHYAYYKFSNGMIRGFEFHFSGEENLSIYSKYIEYIYASFKRD